MRKKTAIELERERITKVTRALVRLKYSLKADEEINDLLPETLEEFEIGIQSGELRQLEPRLLESLLGE